jgi:hypothetical protein
VAGELNVSYFQVMSSVSDYIIEVAPKEDGFDGKKLGFQMNFDTTFR